MSSRYEARREVPFVDVLPEIWVLVSQWEWWAAQLISFILSTVLISGLGALMAVVDVASLDDVRQVAFYVLLGTVVAAVLRPLQEANKEFDKGVNGARDPVLRVAARGGAVPADAAQRAAAAALVDNRRAERLRGPLAGSRRTLLQYSVLVGDVVLAVVLALTAASAWWVVVAVLVLTAVALAAVRRRRRQREDQTLAALSVG